MKIGILSGGGDCAGINGVIRAAVRRAESYGYSVAGIRRGWAGLLEPDIADLRYDAVADILPRGGTILLTSRTNPFKKDGGPELVLKNVKRLGIDWLIVIGGEDTQGVAHKLSARGLRFVGVPKTMDNDLSETDSTFGFDSAVNAAMEAIDRIKTTGESHERVIVVEVMGRDSGWVALNAGIACGANVILVPEEEVDVAAVCKTLKSRARAGKRFSLVVCAEGARLGGSQGMLGEKLDEFGHPRLGGIATPLSQEITRRTGLEAREAILGHVIRGGSPSAFDRVFSTRLGAAAVDLVKAGKSDVMPALRGEKIVAVPVARALKRKTVDRSVLRLAREFSL